MKSRQVSFFLYWRVENEQFWINSFGILVDRAFFLTFLDFAKMWLELWKCISEHKEWNRELTLKCKCKCYLIQWITHSALALEKGNREPHEAKKKYFDLGGNRTHDLRTRSTVNDLPTEPQGRTEKVGDDLRWWIAARWKEGHAWILCRVALGTQRVEQRINSEV